METSKSKDDWIKVSSKSRPGRYYMFNRATGETQWLTQTQSTKDDAGSKGKGKSIESPPRLSAPKPLKTPAQDRLKRLQHAIKVDQTKKPPSKNTNRRSAAADVEGKSKWPSYSKEQQENLMNEKPSTSSTNKTKQKTSPTKSYSSPVRASKRPHSTIPEEKELKKLAKVSPSTSSTKKELLKETEDRVKSTPGVTPNKTLDMDFEMVPCDSFLTPRKPIKVQRESVSQTSALTRVRTGIVNKIKEICSLPFRSSSRVDTKDRKTSQLVAKPTFKPEKKTEKKTEHLSSPVQQACNELREEQKKNQQKNINKNTVTSSPDNSSEQQQSTPKNLSVPSYQRGSANSRLDRLRQSLLLQQTSTRTNAVAETTLLAVTADLASNAKQQNASTALNHSTISEYQTANNTINDEIEAMDWQEEESSIEISSTESNVSLLKQNETKSSNTNPSTSGPETMGDIYDTVNENLLRLSAEKQRGLAKNKNKWLKDFYYFVVDTNVLLEHLSFIEDLTKLKLCDTKGSMLYIPYGVLQELDKLKMRSGCKEGVKTLSVRAIKYLNKKFENKSQHLLAQTALEERDHLIDVNSADDSIINCCLQAKAHVPNLLLLTEDVNLRNKAICNNILVSTKSDLVSKRYDTASDHRAVSS